MSEDQIIRKAGFEILERPNYGQVIWLKRVPRYGPGAYQKYTHRLAIILARNELAEREARDEARRQPA